MWRSVFLHDFPDQRVRSYESVDGALAPSSESLAVSVDPATRRGSLTLLAGEQFVWMPTEPLREIIGVSVRLRITGSVSGFVSMATFRITSGIECDLSIRRPVFGPSKPTDVAVRAGAGGAAFADAVPALGRPVDVRLDWHTSGQTRLWADGRLVGYHNAVSPGAALQIDRVAFGLPFPEPEEFHRQSRHFTVSRVFVRALARPDTLAGFSRLLPAAEPTVDDLLRKCRLTATSRLLATVDRLRAFMATAHQALTQPWTAPGGPDAGPFTAAATAAHLQATAAGAALVEMVRRGDYSSPDDFLCPFEAFLRVLHDALPSQFTALASELLDRPVVPEECRPVMEKALDPWREEYAPLISLLTDASARVRAVAEGA